MKDESLRKAMHTAVEECLSGVEGMPSQRARVFERIEGKQRAGKTYAVPALALMLTMLLAAGAAAGFGLFGQIRASKVDETSYARLERLEDEAASIGQAHCLSVPGTDYEIELTIHQAYCDGRRLYYSYALRESTSDAYNARMGDGAQLPDGTYLNPVDSGYGRTEDGAATAYYEVELPEGIEPGENLTFELRVMVYENGRYAKEKSVDVPVTVPVTGHLTALRGEGVLDVYAVKARLFVSDVDVSGVVEFDTPEGDVTDRLVLLADGVPMKLTDSSVERGGETSVAHVRFDLPEGAENYALAYDGEVCEALALAKGE